MAHDGGCGVRPEGLTKNEGLVWEALNDDGEPQKAYEILDKLKERGVRAPMTVYRALDGLERKGFIHKLEGLNSFVLCNHEAPHSIQVFFICDHCKFAKEVSMDTVETSLAPAFRATGFQMDTARLEAHGACRDCQGRVVA